MNVHGRMDSIRYFTSFLSLRSPRLDESERRWETNPRKHPNFQTSPALWQSQSTWPQGPTFCWKRRRQIMEIRWNLSHIFKIPSKTKICQNLVPFKGQQGWHKNDLIIAPSWYRPIPFPSIHPSIHLMAPSRQLDRPRFAKSLHSQEGPFCRYETLALNSKAPLYLGAETLQKPFELVVPSKMNEFSHWMWVCFMRWWFVVWHNCLFVIHMFVV